MKLVSNWDESLYFMLDTIKTIRLMSAIFFTVKSLVSIYGGFKGFWLFIG